MIPAGLCDSCRHRRIVRNDRRSRFILCLRSRTDPRFARYPRLPVGECPGFEPREGEGDGESTAAARRSAGPPPPTEAPPDAVPGGA